MEEQVGPMHWLVPGTGSTGPTCIILQGNCAKALHSAGTCGGTPGGLQRATYKTRPFGRKREWDIPFLGHSCMHLLILS